MGKKLSYNCLQRPSSGNRNDFVRKMIFKYWAWIKDFNSEYPVKGRGSQTSDGSMWKENTCVVWNFDYGKKFMGDAL